jgi:SlyX protein
MTDVSTEALARLDALEMAMAHQDVMLLELNDVVMAQWRRIDLLERKLALLQNELQSPGATRDGPEPPPPHY